jgi:polyhydroxyalkanoate synthesis regulator protein
VAERESKGESVLPVAVLTDLVRSYTSQASSVVPQFLAMSFDMLRDSQSKVVDNITKVNPIAQMPGMEAFRSQQEAFFKAMTGGQWTPPSAEKVEDPKVEATESKEDLDAIKTQLADLQEKLSKLSK